VDINSNVLTITGFSYFCIFTDVFKTKYVADAVFEKGLLAKCPVPFITNSSISWLVFRIQEVVFDGKVSFSNNITIALQLLPFIDTMDPPILPAFEQQALAVQVQGRNFIAGQTAVFFGDFHRSLVTVINGTHGTFLVPANQAPGIVRVRVTNNLLRKPLMISDVRVLEFYKVPEVHRLLPSEVPTSDIA